MSSQQPFSFNHEEFKCLSSKTRGKDLRKDYNVSLKPDIIKNTGKTEFLYLLSIFHFNFSNYVYVYVGIWAHECRCPQKPEAGNPLELEFQASVSRCTWMLWTELVSFARAANPVNGWAICPVLYWMEAYAPDFLQVSIRNVVWKKSIIYTENKSVVSCEFLQERLGKKSFNWKSIQKSFSATKENNPWGRRKSKRSQLPDTNQAHGTTLAIAEEPARGRFLLLACNPNQCRLNQACYKCPLRDSLATQKQTLFIHSSEYEPHLERCTHFQGACPLTSPGLPLMFTSIRRGPVESTAWCSGLDIKHNPKDCVLEALFSAGRSCSWEVMGSWGLRIGQGVDLPMDLGITARVGPG